MKNASQDVHRAERWWPLPDYVPQFLKVGQQGQKQAHFEGFAAYCRLVHRQSVQPPKPHHWLPVLPWVNDLTCLSLSVLIYKQSKQKKRIASPASRGCCGPSLRLSPWCRCGGVGQGAGGVLCSPSPSGGAGLEP